MKKTLLMILILALILSAGCTGSSTPDDAVKGYLNALTTFDMEKANDYVTSPSEELSAESTAATIMEGVLAKVSYEDLTLVAEEESSATVEVTITGPDMGVLMEQATALVFQEALSSETALDETAMQELLANFFTEALEDPDLVYVSDTITVPLKKNDGAWKISDEGTDAISYAILGSFYEMEF